MPEHLFNNKHHPPDRCRQKNTNLKFHANPIGPYITNISHEPDFIIYTRRIHCYGYGRVL